MVDRGGGDPIIGAEFEPSEFTETGTYVLVKPSQDYLAKHLSELGLVI